LDKQIFISYSHRDERWRDRLITALAPLAHRDEIDVWADTMIMPGENWHETIEDHIERSNVAVMMVSAAFLASKYIIDTELPQVLASAKQGRLTVAWVPVSASMWEVTELAKFQATIDPRRPLDQMTRAEADQALVTVGRQVAGARTLTDLGRTMRIIDDAYDEVSEQAGLEPRQVEYRALAHNTGDSVVFVERGETEPLEKITAADLALLPDEEHRLIQSLERTMRNEYERWTELRPRRSTLTASERQTYQTAGRDMCQELNSILDFIEGQLHKDLEDHYNGIRYACRKLIEVTA
jgi:hypothetical protein